jgi:hypothetical protein|eukprot:2938579-Prymnesium_polylepis.1
MKFGRVLASTRQQINGGHAEAFLPYKELKKDILKQYDPPARRIVLEAQVERLNTHLFSVVLELEAEFELCQMTEPTQAMGALGELAELAQRCEEALVFAECNAAALRKISKKWDKRLGTSLQAVAIGWTQSEPFCVDLPIRLRLLQNQILEHARALVAIAAVQTWAAVHAAAA